MRNRLDIKNPKHFLILTGMLIILGICVQFGAAYVLDLILSMLPSVSEAYDETLSTLLQDDFRIMLTVFLIAPVVEETVFRLLILRLGARFIPFWIMNIIQGILFGKYHGNWVQGIYAFILGMLLGYVLNATGLIISSIIVHMSINITGVLIQRIPLFAEGTSPVIPVIAVISILLGGAIVFGFSQPKGRS